MSRKTSINVSILVMSPWPNMKRHGLNYARSSPSTGAMGTHYAPKELLSEGLMKLTTHRNTEAPTIAVTQLPICPNR